MKSNEKEFEDRLWKGLEEHFKNKDTLPSPIKSFTIFGISILIWKHLKFRLEFLEISPYKLDGEVPIIFWELGPIEFIFENKFIYRYLYKLKYKCLPEDYR